MHLMTKRLLACVCVAVAIVAASRPASADTNVIAQARTLFQQGVHENLAGHYERAEELFRKSYQLVRHSTTLRNLADSEAGAGHLAAAARDYSQLLHGHVQPPLDAKAKHRIEKALQGLQPRVGRLQITVDVDGAVVTVDGEPAGKSPLATAWYVTVGKHEVVAQKAGLPVRTQSVEVAAGQAQRVMLSLKSTPATAPTVASRPDPEPGAGSGAPPVPGPQPAHDQGPPADRSGRPVWPLYVGGGVTVAGLAVGIGFTLAAGSKRSDANALKASLTSKAGAGACAGGTRYASDCARYHDDLNAVGTDRNVALAGFIAGGVGAAFTVGYLIWRGGSSPSSKQGTSVHPAVAVGSRGAALSLVGRF